MDATRRHWWIVAVALLAGLAGAVAIWATRERNYESSTSVLVDAMGGPVNLETEAQIARSTANAEDAAALLGSQAQAASLLASLSVEGIANTSVLRFRYTAASPRSAQAASHAFAQAYLANRAESARADISGEMSAIGAKLKEFNTQLAGINSQIAQLPESSSELADLSGARTTLTNQIDALTTRINGLATTTITPGAIISDADLPATATGPDIVLFVIGGASAGLMLGMAAVFARRRLDRRVRHGLDVQRAGAPVLVELRGHGGVRGDDLFPARGPGGRSFNRLRNEIVASLSEDERVLLIAGVSSGPASTLVAANLAAALARAGDGVVLIGANVPEIGSNSIPLSRLFDVADIPGLTDVLAHRASLFRALQQAPLIPGLRVVTPGGTASASGLLQTPGVRTALSALRHQAGYVIVEAPSAAAGADAQSLARLADVAILVAEVGASRRTEVADAANQVRRVGTRLLGTVVTPRLIAGSLGQSDFLPAHRAEDSRERETDVWLSTVGDATPGGTAVDTPTSAFDHLHAAELDSAGSDSRQPAAG